jgi:hypothetical protein
MKRSLKYIFLALLIPAAMLAAPPAATSSSDRTPVPEGTVPEGPGIALELSVWMPIEGVHDAEAASTTSTRWLRPPHSALLWLPGNPARINGANDGLEPRRQLEW